MPKGLTEVRTRVSGFKVLSDYRYTMRPPYYFEYASYFCSVIRVIHVYERNSPFGLRALSPLAHFPFHSQPDVLYPTALPICLNIQNKKR